MGWLNSHFGAEHWTNSHFGCDPEAAGDTTSADFGLDPISLTVLGLGAAGAAAATAHHALAAHHIWTNGRRKSNSQGEAPDVETSQLESDNVLGALQYAAAHDPYAIGQPL